MDSSAAHKPHAICIPYPAQGHINAMIQLSKLLHSRGFHITFVHSQFIHSHLLSSKGLDTLNTSPSFRFETIPDGLPASDDRHDIYALTDSLRKKCVEPFRELVTELNSSLDTPPVTCIVADGTMTFTLQVAEEVGVPEVLFWPMSASGFMGFFQYRELIQRGLVPMKDESCLTNGYLDTRIDWIPGMRDILLKDIPTFIRTTDPNDILLTFMDDEAQNSIKASALILHTFDELEPETLHAIKSIIPKVYTVGPLQMLCRQIVENQLNRVQSSLWIEEEGCLEWLDKQKTASIIYVNFGSLAVVTEEQLREFAWGLANSKYPFLWIVRPDVAMGHQAALSEDFMAEIEGRAMLASWCSQEQVLSHPSIGAFLTHCGWNSMMESICSGVPMICWPFFADQQTNCRYACKEWGIGMEIGSAVNREEIEVIMMEMMQGEKGGEMRKKAVEWKHSGESAAEVGGSSYTNLDKLIDQVLQRTDG
ncbi:7-deoxyloganetin glucosyltransferase-like [Magnolia sinica]|uniref:7-deoxyloganetin glucosyltransferase-like n=1 Tax=Magnolia sinica TaxID=86752 RepID=UPI002659D856|nr:7-deoxyloganetin glucosyltransferase-like [Magnolia sinica]